MAVSPDDNIKVLLVDDNENNLTSMELVLENEGYTFFKATSGKEALRILLKEEDFSLILLDVQMPIMDGYETAELIYQRDKLKRIPIIFFTAQDYEEESMFRGYKAGAADFIRKPFKPELLRYKVAIFAELHRKNQLLRKQEEKLRLINDDLVALNRNLEKRVSERTRQLETVNQELKELNISKDKFLSVISHDLRNPLTSLLLSSKTLNDEIEDIDPKKLKMLSGVIHRTSNRILTQLNELVDWAKKQRQKTTFNPQKIQLNDAINEALELLKETAIQKNIKFENQTSTGFFVNADPLMLRSILQNIVTNAIKYSPRKGTVNVSAQLADRMVEVCVQDFGVGMSEKTRSTILGANGATSLPGTDKEQGTGLGLLLVKDFVAQHGGRISIDSKLRKGTSFKFTIPAN
ncbi:MAG: hybrid sensor histidine kinase/response regulator [Mucilaginibacter sp.]|nr:hybrid sensor histidine kinase/response regulator [Mucilaginibacter sp.]